MMHDKTTKPIIGVLALQGAVMPHKPHIESAGGVFRAVKAADDFAAVDGFILPGGESTTMLKLIENFNLWDVLNAQFATKPVWGVCAGAILMAKSVHAPTQKSFGVLPITVQRNGYGRQLDSHIQNIDAYPVSFIRAPLITDMPDDVDVLATHRDTPVWVRRADKMATTFHPELTLDFPSPMHVMFLDMINTAKP